MKVTAVSTLELATPRDPAALFDAWLDPAQVRQWMSVALQRAGLAGDLRRVEIDAQIGGRFFFSDQRDGIEARHWGRYVEIQRPHRLVFTWITDESEEADPSLVTLEISPARATITHEMDEAWRDYLPRVEAAWRRMLQAIAELNAPQPG